MASLAFDIEKFLAELPELPNPPSSSDQLEALAGVISRYYAALSAAGLPKGLIIRLVGELHNFLIWKSDR